jgi:4-hydroxybenzoate polyprenyltransferase
MEKIKQTLLNTFSFLADLMKLLRWPNLLIMALTMFMLRYYLIRPMYLADHLDLQLPLPWFVLLVFSVVILAAGGYVINDYFDVRIDEFNKPGKAVLGRKIGIKLAIPLHATLTTAGIVAGLLVSVRVGNLKLVFIHLLAGLLLWLYSARYKRKPFWGNLVIAFCSALSVGVVWLFEMFAMGANGTFITNQSELHMVNRGILFFIFFAFILTMVREMIKDVEDMAGDERYGCITLPILLGVPVVRWIAFSLVIVTMGSLAFVQYFLYGNLMKITAHYFFVIHILLLYGAWLLIQAREKADFALLSQLFRLVMVAGVLSLQLYHVDF